MYILQLIIYLLKSSLLPENSLGMFIFFLPEEDGSIVGSVPKFILYGNGGDDGGDDFGIGRAIGSGVKFLMTISCGPNPSLIRSVFLSMKAATLGT